MRNTLLLGLAGFAIATPTSTTAAPSRFAYTFQSQSLEDAPDPEVQRRYTADFHLCQGAAEATFQIVTCLEAEFAKQDAVLNTVWRATLPRFANRDHSALIKAERAWSRGRDPFCRIQADAYRGGTIQPVVYSSCRVDQTIRRIIWLEALP